MEEVLAIAESAVMMVLVMAGGVTMHFALTPLPSSRTCLPSAHLVTSRRHAPLAPLLFLDLVPQCHRLLKLTVLSVRR